VAYFKLLTSKATGTDQNSYMKCLIPFCDTRWPVRPGMRITQTAELLMEW